MIILRPKLNLAATNRRNHLKVKKAIVVISKGSILKNSAMIFEDGIMKNVKNIRIS